MVEVAGQVAGCRPRIAIDRLGSGIGIAGRLRYSTKKVSSLGAATVTQ
jgi:hypothetical protein